MSRSVEELERRSRQDIGVVEKMEVELRGLENKFKEVEAGHESSRARHYQVSAPANTCTLTHVTLR